MNSESKAIRDAAVDLWHLHATFSGKIFKGGTFDALPEAEKRAWEAIVMRTSWHGAFADMQESFEETPDSRDAEENE